MKVKTKKNHLKNPKRKTNLNQNLLKEEARREKQQRKQRMIVKLKLNHQSLLKTQEKKQRES